ncbi:MULTISPECIES: decaprenyl-phosphate phosphoribosyltransferase [unclassified Aeromicrobium]|uniref:decaprenyl-phosphate phosphoribosyltransferase n=1 Tax=unclassified Aeromicrobium TaxID=2633570 RepID=UPI0006FD32A0|nr:MULTISPECIES: decaprenyl-phosphate phosphoribosyltransferase [unclassified Aeromicrobium]KQO37500.1 phosphoribose diphosphate--decaprenyl-phosphate phosphoribosyltransferase [Aeromicrobium sp. Leaf245]KQP76029.1 phosphoribose diphosphate--decaprenyl-phosphate phosphoribosyltransferase [Aeromicrobium sp. Leaf289]KQP85056.1 phosphoribose diphosphate--decaprenyl-phosphate phosphoribosyltransferase [Aeromicrobium sp. Leaf291]
MTTSTRRRAPLLRATRPRQWTKNLLVLAAPLAAGVLTDGTVLRSVSTALVAFTACAAAVYLLNDVVDVEDDRRHPRKRHRPVASGELSRSTAVVFAAVLAVAGVGLAVAVRPMLAAVLLVYLVVQVAYAYWLKDQPVLDLAVVSSGFLLRAIAGGVAADVPLSQWFLLVASFGSLFMVAGKRYSELLGVGAEGGTRPSLALYSESYLRFVWSTAAAVAVTAYSLWAFEIPSDATVNWQALSIAPFVLGMLRYAVDIDRGLAGEPEDAVMRDPVLLVLAAAWIVLFAVGVYVS